MGADHRAELHDAHAGALPHRQDLPPQLFRCLRIVGVDDVNVLVDVLRRRLVKELHEPCDPGLAPAALFKVDQRAVGLDLQQGMDVQQRSDHGRGRGDAPAALEEAKVVHHKPVLDLESVLFQPADVFMQTHAAIAVVGCGLEQQTHADRGAAAVDTDDFGVGVTLAQLHGRERGRLQCAGQAAGEGDVQNVLAVAGEHFEEILVNLRGDLRGRGLSALAQCLVEIAHAALVPRAGTDELLPVEQIGHRDEDDSLLLREDRVDICRGVGDDTVTFIHFSIPHS